MLLKDYGLHRSEFKDLIGKINECEINNLESIICNFSDEKKLENKNFHETKKIMNKIGY